MEHRSFFIVPNFHHPADAVFSVGTHAAVFSIERLVSGVGQLLFWIEQILGGHAKNGCDLRNLLTRRTWRALVLQLPDVAFARFG
jgi:hypothetical protein